MVTPHRCKLVWCSLAMYGLYLFLNKNGCELFWFWLKMQCYSPWFSNQKLYKVGLILLHDKFIVDSIIWGYSLPWKSETLKKVFFWVSFQEYCLWLKNILHISEWWNYAYRLVRLEKSYIRGLLCFSLKSKLIVYGFTRKFHKFRLTRVLVKW